MPKNPKILHPLDILTGRLMAEVADFPKRVVIAPWPMPFRHLSAFSIADAFLET